MRVFLTLVIMIAMIAFIGCSAEAEKETAAETTTSDTTASETSETPAADTTAGEMPTDASTLTTKDSGVRYIDLVVGDGVEATNLMPVECHYTLWFSDSTGLVKMERFQSSKDGGKPFACTLGQRLIAGWSDGMIGMKEGGTRQLHIPWALGYGAAGGGPIPPKTNLIFEIEFLRKM